jgi:hypothetical protein
MSADVVMARFEAKGRKARFGEAINRIEKEMPNAKIASPLAARESEDRRFLWRHNRRERPSGVDFGLAVQITDEHHLIHAVAKLLPGNSDVASSERRWWRR